jgi:hypothetical protein
VEPKHSTESIEIRCRKPDCPLVRYCLPRGKFIATIKSVPKDLKGRGVVLQLPCPKQKSVLLKFEI